MSALMSQQVTPFRSSYSDMSGTGLMSLANA